MMDLAEKLERAENQLSMSGKMMGGYMQSPDKKKEESQLTKVSRERLASFFFFLHLNSKNQETKI